MNNNTNDFWLKLEALQFDRMYAEKNDIQKQHTINAIDTKDINIFIRDNDEIKPNNKRTKK